MISPASVVELADVLAEVRKLPPRQRRRVWDFVDRDCRQRMAGGVPWPVALPQSLAAALRPARNPGANKVTRHCPCGTPIPPTFKQGRPRLRCPDCGGKPWRNDERAEEAA